MAFIASPAREMIASGGYGSGKSLALALKLAMRASVPGAHELLIRKWNVTLHKSTLRTLLEGDGDTPPVLPHGTYRHNKVEQQVHINKGGTISYLGTDQAEKLGSINATGAAIDEAAELSQADYLMIRGRCRSRAEGLANQVYMATNPKGPRHFLAIRFGLDGQSTPAPNSEALFMATDENPYLPTDYIADLSSLTGTDRKRCFEGRWVQAEGLVYSQFDSARMIRRRESQWQQIVVGQDAGFNDPDVMLVICKDGDGRVHVAAEWCMSGQLMDAVVEQAHRFREQFNVSKFAVDPSAARLRETLTQAGLQVEKAENAILDGIRAVQRYMVIDGTGEPMFTVDPSCEHLIRELESYAWHADRADVPIDKFNHCCDAMRYGVMAMDHPGGNAWCGVVDVGNDDDDDDDSRSIYGRLAQGWADTGQAVPRQYRDPFTH